MTDSSFQVCSHAAPLHCNYKSQYRTTTTPSTQRRCSSTPVDGAAASPTAVPQVRRQEGKTTAAGAYAATACLTGRLLFLMPVMAKKDNRQQQGSRQSLVRRRAMPVVPPLLALCVTVLCQQSPSCYNSVTCQTCTRPGTNRDRTPAAPSHTKPLTVLVAWAVEHCRASHQRVGTSLNHLPGVVGGHAAVDLDPGVDALQQQARTKGRCHHMRMCKTHTLASASYARVQATPACHVLSHASSAGGLKLAALNVPR